MTRGPITVDPMTGEPLLLRDSRLASQNFHLQRERWDGVPKSKFLFYVRFMRSQSMGGTGSGGLDWSRGVGLVVKNVDRPKVSFDLQTLNQYNKKRVVQSKVEYQPMSIRFHDTVDNRVFNMFEEYFRFYYGDPRAVSDVDWNWDVTSNQLRIPGTGYWGFNPPKVDPNFAYFFSRIEIYQLYAGKYSRFDIIHPKIASFDPDEMDYSNGGNGHEITMSLNFEGIVYQGNNLTLNSDLAQEMGLDLSNFYDVDVGNIGSGDLTADFDAAMGYADPFNVDSLFQSAGSAGLMAGPDYPAQYQTPSSYMNPAAGPNRQSVWDENRANAGLAPGNTGDRRLNRGRFVDNQGSPVNQANRFLSGNK